MQYIIGVAAIGGKPPLHVVSALPAEYSLVLEQSACEEKSREVTAVPKLLDM